MRGQPQGCPLAVTAVCRARSRSSNFSTLGDLGERLFLFAPAPNPTHR
jgi:hypothetical protein